MPSQAATERISSELAAVSSLKQHRQIQARLRLEARTLKAEIATLQCELNQGQDPGRMGVIQNLIAQLMLQVNLIREKASEAEAIVKSITTDIQRLDVAKKNLTASMKSVERWNMLVQAQTQMDRLVTTQQYREMAQVLSAINQLSQHLRPMIKVPTVAALFRKIQQSQAAVKEKADTEMEVFLSGDVSKQPDRQVLADVCAVIEELGADYKSHVIERYYTSRLQEYRRIFRSTDEAGQLDNVPRRFAWFRRLLKQHDEEAAAIFPDSWAIAEILVVKFSESTRSDLVNVLEKSPPAVGHLLEALQSTQDFEESMAKRFNMPFSKLLEFGDSSRSMSTAFESHLQVYVDAQDRAISDMLAAYRGSKSRPSLEGVLAFNEEETPAPAILPSSTELFYFYGQTLDQCSKYTTGPAMQKLAGVFSKWLKVYSDDILLPSLKKSDTGRRSLDSRPDLLEIRKACMVINTADYCQTTALQLEETLKAKIDSGLRDNVSFQAQRDVFNGVISTCISAILRELELSCEPAFSAILKTPWMHLENVSGRSAYIVDLVGSVKQVAEMVRSRIESKRFIRNLADKAVGLIITRFTQAVVKSRPLKKIGAEQILLDIQAVKACLLDLPGTQSETAASSYNKYVTKHTGQLETMLKVILAPDEVPEGFVQNYCLLIGDRSFSNFQKILDLKGTARTDQQRLLDIFLSVTSTQDDLSDTSFLSTLDMDPGDKQLTSPTGGLPSPLTRGASVDGPDGLFRSETPKAFGEFRRLVSFATRIN